MTVLSQIRGDTRRYRFKRINADGSTIEIEPDKIYFTVKKSYIAKDILIQKKKADFVIDNNHVYHFTIEPDDTNGLKYGNYVYDIEVITDGVKTTISKGDFIIEPEVTFADDED